MSRNDIFRQAGWVLVLAGFLTGLTTLGVFTPAAFGAEGRWPFFAMDNGAGRGRWTPQEQAATLKELGYDGISYTYTNNLELKERMEAFRQAKLKIFALLFPARLDRPEGIDRDLVEAMRMLKGSDTILWLMYGCRYGQDDDTAVKLVRKVADLAAQSNLRVALYPRAGTYVATAKDALRIVQEADRDNAGVTLNLGAELLANNGNRLPEVVRTVGARLFVVTVNGADRPGGGGRYILPLVEGDFDVAGLLKTLHDSGYRGPIGLQGLRVPGDQKENLRRSMATWKEYQGN